jgi:hypothetical protein
MLIPQLGDVDVSLNFGIKVVWLSTELLDKSMWFLFDFLSINRIDN